MTEPVPGLVTLHLWRVPGRHAPAALTRVAADRRRVRAAPGVRFAKLLGTANGQTFTLRDANLGRWALLAAWADPGAAAAFERSAVARQWHRIAAETWRLELRPLAARGRWSRRQPFGGSTSGGYGGSARSGGPAGPARAGWDGAVAALTRARIAPRALRSFWRAVPPVATDLQGRAGLRLAIGIGEAPVGVQGTFSVWESARSLRAFAYAGAPHAEVVRRTAVEGWYAEQLFARFAVLSATGTVDGRDPLA